MKKLISILLVVVLAVSFAACSTPKTPNSDIGTKTLTVGATAAPHAEILEFVKPILANQGITLKIVEFTDYPLINTALNEKQIDANYFQHQPYLDDYNKSNKTDLISAGSIHFEPLGIYPGKVASVDDLKDGDTIAIPSDPTNGARALLLLEEKGVITLLGNKGLASTVNDIDTKATQNKKIVIREVDAAQIPNTLPDIALGVINGNYAIGAGIADTMVASENPQGDIAQNRANIVAVRAGDETREDIKALITALQSEKTRTFIEQKYGVSVVCVF